MIPQLIQCLVEESHEINKSRDSQNNNQEEKELGKEENLIDGLLLFIKAIIVLVDDCNWPASATSSVSIEKAPLSH
ncbi:hypothetical protein T10_7151 [Trichinella papuae]|uniref:Uncharacterized protein n=1 Tax=Trichinella papuae TaxID=268474 RepID=A0A0V1N8N1_9BILA|nr:hypothetical protein T10_7151 [Trichinella papuae]